MTFEDEVRGALELNSDAASGSLIMAVIKQLQAADPRASYASTGYFNHSFQPDIFASWGPAGKRSSRPYYLRLSLDPVQARQDLETLGSENPGIIGLLPTDDPQGMNDAPLEGAGVGTLVAEGSALEELSTKTEDDGFAQLIPSAVVRSGRGFLDESAATELASAGERGFETAASANEEDTRSVLETFRRYMSSSQAVELERTLGVAWIGSGGDPGEFPASVDIDSSPLPGTLRETLRILFNKPSIEQAGFWSRLAGWISVDDLLSFEGLQSSANLRNLMDEARVNLRFVSALLANGSVPEGELYQWSVGNKGLLLSVAGASLHFAHDGRVHGGVAATAEGESWASVGQRLAGQVVDRAGFDSGSVSVRIEATAAADNAQEQVLEKIDAMTGLGNVREVVVVSESGAKVKCRLRAQVATAENSNKVPADELGWLAATVLRDLPASTSEAFATALGRDVPEPIAVEAVLDSPSET